MNEFVFFSKGSLSVAFQSGFPVKFEIPDYLGLGKSVSRGFGTVKKAKTKAERGG
jgi:hypothetical protein